MVMVAGPGFGNYVPPSPASSGGLRSRSWVRDPGLAIANSSSASARSTRAAPASPCCPKGLLSPALAKRLPHAEAELAALPAPSTVVRVDDVLRRLPDAVKCFRRMAARLGDAPIDVERGRAALKGLLGPIWITPRDGYLVAKMGLECQPLLGSSIRGSGGTLWHIPAAHPVD